MERETNLIYKSKIFLCIIFGVGIIGHLVDLSKQLMLLLTPLALFITASVVFLNLYESKNKKLLVWLLATYLITFAIEVIGVKTSLIFGQYSYGETLGLKLFDVPIVIGINWVFVILGAINLAGLVFSKDWMTITASAVFALLFDLLLEPVAIKLNYWQWPNGIIPLQNYIAWFLISLIAGISFVKLKLNINSNLPRFYFLVQVVFFLALLLFY